MTFGSDLTILILLIIILVALDIATQKAVRWAHKMLTKRKRSPTIGDNFGEQG